MSCNYAPKSIWSVLTYIRMSLKIYVFGGEDIPYRKKKKKKKEKKNLLIIVKIADLQYPDIQVSL